MEEEEISSRFLKRQKVSNPVVSGFLAIPHIVIDGESKIFFNL